MSNPLVIGSREFATRTEATEFFRAMLASYNDGERITGDDAQILYALIQRHPNADFKMGAGVDHFKRVKHPNYKSSGFWVYRIDGTRDDFSYPQCVRSKGKTPVAMFVAACRWAVRKDVMLAKHRAFEKYADLDGRIPCEISGELIYADEAYLDYTKPFLFTLLVDCFIEKYRIDIEDNLVERCASWEHGTRFVSAKMAIQFREYHAHMCQLRIVASSLSRRDVLKSPACPPVRPVTIEINPLEEKSRFSNRAS